MESFWTQVNESTLRQGDMLPRCLIPIFKPGFGGGEEPVDVGVVEADLIIVTQSCDLANAKVVYVALCPILTLERFEEKSPNFKTKGRWEQVRKGRVEGLHLLASTTNPEQNRESLVVGFGQIVSLPFDYLTDRAMNLGDRWRLDSPFLEHFSQAFARFFMRVGLPSAIPPFR